MITMHNSAFYQSEGFSCFKFHNTTIAKWNDYKIILNHGGYTTYTTKKRLNELSGHFHLGFQIYQENFSWYIVYKGKTIPWIDREITLERIDLSMLSIERLSEYLSLGSGIDCEWTFETLKNGKIRASNSFHCMNNYGMYCGYADFSITIDPKNPLSFRLQFHGNEAQDKNKRFLLRDYLEETLHHSIFSILTKENPYKVD